MTFEPASQTRGEFSIEEWMEEWHMDGDPPYHQKQYNDLLVKYLCKMFPGGRTGRVFVPLCGKTLDMIYLADQGHEVVGLEFSKVGIGRFFQENHMTYVEQNVEGTPFVKYRAKEKKITIFRGDLFQLNPEICGTFDASWDRGSYVAINIPTRRRYAELMAVLLKPSAKILMEVYTYDQSKLSGPPHCIRDENLQVFGKDFEIAKLESTTVKAPPNLHPDMEWSIAAMLLSHK